MKVFAITAASFANADVRFLNQSGTATNATPSTTAPTTASQIGNSITSAIAPVTTAPKIITVEAGGAMTSSGGFIIDDTTLETKQT